MLPVQNAAPGLVGRTVGTTGAPATLRGVCTTVQKIGACPAPQQSPPKHGGTASEAQSQRDKRSCAGGGSEPGKLALASGTGLRHGAAGRSEPVAPRKHARSVCYASGATARGTRRRCNVAPCLPRASCLRAGGEYRGHRSQSPPVRAL